MRGWCPHRVHERSPWEWFPRFSSHRWWEAFSQLARTPSWLSPIWCVLVVQKWEMTMKINIGIYSSIKLLTNRFISWDVPSWTQEIIVEAKISKIGWCDGSAKSWKKIPARMSRDVKNSTANDITWPLKVMTFFRFLK